MIAMQAHRRREAGSGFQWLLLEEAESPAERLPCWRSTASSSAQCSEQCRVQEAHTAQRQGWGSSPQSYLPNHVAGTWATLLEDMQEETLSHPALVGTTLGL